MSWLKRMPGQNETGGRSRRPEQREVVLDCGDGLKVPLTVRRQPRAKRIILKMVPGRAAAVVSVPPGVALAEGLAFAESRKEWIAARVREHGAPVAFAHGAQVPYLGTPHLIVHVPHRRGTVWREESAGGARLCVAGAREHLARRLKDWMMKQAKEAFARSCRHYARAMGATYTRISVRDQTTRWGSCSSRGALNFSWRLIMAPPFVLDYIAAHEVAHLKEMNHSPRFWRLVASHCAHWRKAEQWLNAHGRSLHRYGA